MSTDLQGGQSHRALALAAVGAQNRDRRKSAGKASSLRFRRFLHFLRLTAAVLFWPVLAVVLWYSVVPSGVPAAVDDKLQHFAAYFALGWLAAAAMRDRRFALVAGGMLIALGGGVELAQFAVPDREASFADAFANAVGVIAGALAARAIVEPLRQRFPAGIFAGRG